MLVMAVVSIAPHRHVFVKREVSIVVCVVHQQEHSSAIHVFFECVDVFYEVLQFAHVEQSIVIYVRFVEHTHEYTHEHFFLLLARFVIMAIMALFVMAIFVMAIFVMVIGNPMTPEFIPREVAIVVCVKRCHSLLCCHFISVVTVIVMPILFHPHVSCSFTFFFSGVIRVGMAGCIVAVVTFVFVVFVFYHPHEAGCFAVCFIVDVIVGMVVHIVTNTVSFLAMFVTVLITVFISMVTVVVVCVSTKHLEDGHCEVFWVICVELNDVFALFQVEDRDHCVSRASCRVGDCFFCFEVIVTFVAIFLTGMVIVAIFLIGMVIVAIFLIGMVIMVILCKSEVVCDELSVNFNVISVFFFIDKLNRFVRPFRESFTKIRHEQRLIIKRLFAIRHGVNLDGGWSGAT